MIYFTSYFWGIYKFLVSCLNQCFFSFICQLLYIPCFVPLLLGVKEMVVQCGWSNVSLSMVTSHVTYN